MAKPNNIPVGGIESLEFAPAFFTEGAMPEDSAWRKVPKLAEDSVTTTPGDETKTEITAEDEDSPWVTVNSRGSADVFTFAFMDFEPEVIAELFDIEYSPATSKMVFLDRIKNANLALRFITRPRNGVKKVTVYPNTDVTSREENGYTKTGLIQVTADATIKTFTTTSGKKGKKITTLVDEDGNPIDATPEG